RPNEQARYSPTTFYRRDAAEAVLPELPVPGAAAAADQSDATAGRGESFHLSVRSSLEDSGLKTPLSSSSAMSWRVASCLVVVAAMFGRPPVAAAPFVPADDNLVLESGLPTVDPRMREMRPLAAELRKNLDDLQTAMQLASRQLAMGVAESDPRFVGYA